MQPWRSGMELATKIWCVFVGRAGGKWRSRCGGKGAILKLGGTGVWGWGKYSSPLTSWFTIFSHFASSILFLRSILSCPGERFQSSWPRSRSEWALTKLMSGMNCLLHFLFGTNFNSRNIQFSNDKWSNLYILYKFRLISENAHTFQFWCFRVLKQDQGDYFEFSFFNWKGIYYSVNLR